MTHASCNHCDQQIATGDAFCSACGAPRHASAPPTIQAPPPAQFQAQAVAVKPPVNYEVFLLAIPVVGIFLTWFWVGSMNLAQSPGSMLNLISVATVLGTAFAAATEARALGMARDKKKGSYGPVAWFFLFVLLWIAAYPAYLRKRRAYGMQDRMWPGILLAIVFSVGLVGVAVNIGHKKAEARGAVSQPASGAGMPARTALAGAYSNAEIAAVSEHIGTVNDNINVLASVNKEHANNFRLAGLSKNMAEMMRAATAYRDAVAALKDRFAGVQKLTGLENAKASAYIDDVDNKANQMYADIARIPADAIDFLNNISTTTKETFTDEVRKEVADSQTARVQFNYAIGAAYGSYGFSVLDIDLTTMRLKPEALKR